MTSAICRSRPAPTKSSLLTDASVSVIAYMPFRSCLNPELADFRYAVSDRRHPPVNRLWSDVCDLWLCKVTHPQV